MDIVYTIVLRDSCVTGCVWYDISLFNTFEVMAIIPKPCRYAFI